MPPIYVTDLLMQGHAGQLTDVPLSGIRAVEHGKRRERRVQKVLEYIELIGEQGIHAQRMASMPPGGSQVTRVITDEFSFYPKRAPFTTLEYKKIIQGTAAIASKLPPDCHLVLATFPILWPDGGVHNCGLYVQSPKEPGDLPILHHFSKKNHSVLDFFYTKSDGTFYPATADEVCTKEQHPNEVLRDTAVLTNDVNQYGAAIKITTSQGDEFISTIGICLDHRLGIEKKEVQQLILQLQKNDQPVPFQCSHVITSYSIENIPDYTLSTISHADPHSFIRHTTEPFEGVWMSSTSPLPSEGVVSVLNNPFSKVPSTIEQYPAKLIGTFHSDLFLQAVANDPAKADRLNMPGLHGETELHRVLLETNPDHELIAKRLYSMILAGGNPYAVDEDGNTVLDLIEDVPDIIDFYVQKALDRSKLKHSQHVKNFGDILDKVWDPNEDKNPSYILNEFIQQGGNPYQKDDTGISALDFLQRYPPFERVFMINQLQNSFEKFHSRAFVMGEESVLEEAWHVDQFNAYLRTLSREQRQPLLEECLSVALDERNEDKLKFYINCLSYELPRLISSFGDFTKLFLKFTNPQYREDVFAIMQKKLASFTDEPPHELIELLSESQLKCINIINKDRALSRQWSIGWALRDECWALFEDISSFKNTNIGDIDIEGFLFEKNKELESSYDISLMTAVRDELQQLHDSLREKFGFIFSIKLECNEIIEKIEQYSIDEDDVEMECFLKEQFELIYSSDDKSTLDVVKQELQSVFDALSNDEFLVEIIKLTRKQMEQDASAIKNEDRERGELIQSALKKVPVVHRHEIMNEEITLPELEAVREALNLNKGHKLQVDLEESKSADAFKSVKNKYREQSQEHQDSSVTKKSGPK